MLCFFNNGRSVLRIIYNRIIKLLPSTLHNTIQTEDTKMKILNNK